MDRTLAADRRPGVAPTTTGTPHLRLRARKPLLVAHLIVSGTWLGAVVADLFLGISAATSGREELADAYYAVMDRLVNNLMPAAAIAHARHRATPRAHDQMGAAAPLLGARQARPRRGHRRRRRCRHRRSNPGHDRRPS